LWDSEHPTFDDAGRPVAASETEFLFKPGRLIDEAAERLHGISNAAVADAQPFAARAADFQAMIEASDAVVSHDLTFDRYAIDIEMKRLDRSVRWPRLICLLQQTEHLQGYPLPLRDEGRRPGLYRLLFSEAAPEPANLRNDTTAVLRCFVALAQRGAV
jgi:hypothetical protein